MAAALQINPGELRQLQPKRKINRAKPRRTSFAQLLTDQRRTKGMEQYRLARLAGVSASMVNQLENGKILPSPAVLNRLSTALQLDPDVLSQHLHT